MAARGAGAVLSRAAVVLGLMLLWTGSAGARVHHLTLKVRSAPPPARPPAALGSLWVASEGWRGWPGSVRGPGLSSPPRASSFAPLLSPGPSLSSLLSGLSLCASACPGPAVFCFSRYFPLHSLSPIPAFLAVCFVVVGKVCEGASELRWFEGENVSHPVKSCAVIM